jgi:hypothetical protein
MLTKSNNCKTMKKFSLLFIQLFLCFTVTFSIEYRTNPSNSPIQKGLIPINPGEAIMVGFFEPQYFPIEQWTIGPGASKGDTAKYDPQRHATRIDVKNAPHVLTVWQNNLMGASFQWLRQPEDGTGIVLEKSLEAHVTEYDNLIVAAMLPEKARLKVDLETQSAKVSKSFDRLPGRKREYTIPLSNINTIRHLKMSVLCDEPGSQSGRFLWVGVQNESRLQQYQDNLNPFGTGWPYHLKPTDFEPSYRPQYELVLSVKNLEALRRDYEKTIAQNETYPLLESAKRSMDNIPEELISGSMGKNMRFARDRELRRNLSGPGLKLALAGLIAKDKEMLRRAARYALSMSITPHWDESFFAHFPGSDWSHAAFQEDATAHAVAAILDLAGEMLTPAAKDFIRIQLAREALGHINYITWRHEYIHHMNQLAAFSDGRILSYAILEKSMPRVKPYQEIAYQELVASFEEIIMPDGGYDEGPGYFAYTILSGGWAFHHYARSRDKTLTEVMPSNVQQTADFAEAVSSTQPNHDVIPICDAHTHMNITALAILAAMDPESRWTALYQKVKNRQGGIQDEILPLILDKRIPKEAPPPKAFVHMPDMGLISSTRYLKGQPLKILIMGGPEGATHSHEDKGSFVIEFARQTFAMDMGSVSYGDPLTFISKQCQRHNMLVPVDPNKRASPEQRLSQDIKPKGNGDETAFQASINPTPSFDDYYQKWHRSWSSPSPDKLIIRDDYALKKGKGVEFYWLTQLPVKIEDDQVSIEGEKGRAKIQIPGGCKVRLDKLQLSGGKKQNRIAIINPERKDNMQVEVQFEVISE